MKRFIVIYIAVTLALQLVYFACGQVLFDFEAHYYLASAAIAVPLSLLLCQLLTQALKIDALEKQLSQLQGEGEADGAGKEA